MACTLLYQSGNIAFYLLNFHTDWLIIIFIYLLACDSNEVNVNVCNGCLRVLRHLNIRYGDSMTLCKQQDTRFDRLTVGSLEEYHTMISFLRDDQKLHEDPSK